MKEFLFKFYFNENKNNNYFNQNMKENLIIGLFNFSCFNFIYIKILIIYHCFYDFYFIL